MAKAPAIRSAIREDAALLLIVREEEIILCDIGNPDHENPHPPFRSMHDPRRDMDQRTLPHLAIHSVQDHHALSLEHVVKLGAALMVVLTRTINIDGVHPGRHSRACVLPADQSVTPAARAPLPRNFSLVPNQDWPSSMTFVVRGHSLSVAPVHLVQARIPER